MQVLTSVYDKASELWSCPTASQTLAQARRSLKMSFVKQFGDVEDELLRDFEFYQVGSFDELTGKFEMAAKPFRFFIDDKHKVGELPLV